MKTKHKSTGRTSVPPELSALRRTAKQALELGLRTGTPDYGMENGRIIDLTKRVAKPAKSRRKSGE